MVWPYRTIPVVSSGLSTRGVTSMNFKNYVLKPAFTPKHELPRLLYKACKVMATSGSMPQFTNRESANIQHFFYFCEHCILSDLELNLQRRPLLRRLTTVLNVIHLIVVLTVE